MSKKYSDFIFRVIIFKTIMCNNFENHNMGFYNCLPNKSGYFHRHIIIVVCGVRKHSYLQNLLSDFSIEFDLRQLHSKFIKVNQFLYRPIIVPEGSRISKIPDF